jgi:hypothetical protein
MVAARRLNAANLLPVDPLFDDRKADLEFQGRFSRL